MTHLDPPEGRAVRALDRATSGRRSPSSSLAGSGCSGCSSRSPSSRSTSPAVAVYLAPDCGDNRAWCGRYDMDRGVWSADRRSWTQCTDGWPAAREGGEVVLIEGEPGIGKTRFLAEVLADPAGDFARSAPTPTSSGAPGPSGHWPTRWAVGWRPRSALRRDRPPHRRGGGRVPDRRTPCRASRTSGPRGTAARRGRRPPMGRPLDREVPALRDPTPHRRAGHLRAGVPADPEADLARFVGASLRAARCR